MLDLQLRELLLSARTVAVVGASDRPGRPVDGVGRYLVAAGYRVLPVHPKRRDVWGIEAYPTLADAPGPIDIVDLFRAAEHVPGHARECLALDPLPGLFWMQQGIVSPEAAAILSSSPVRVVQDLCLMKEHGRLVGRG